MGRRDYEMEDAVKAVEGQVAEPIVRALLVGSAGGSEGTLGGALKSRSLVPPEQAAARVS